MARFREQIRIRGVNPYILVRAEIARRLKADWRKPLPVCVRVNGHPQKPSRVNMMPVGDGSFYLYLRGTLRKASGAAVGDVVIVDLSFDRTYRGGPGHPVPRWFRNALERNATARQSWEALIPSRKKEILRYFAGLKSTEAKLRNLKRALEVLSGKEARFMGRTWKNGK